MNQAFVYLYRVYHLSCLQRLNKNLDQTYKLDYVPDFLDDHVKEHQEVDGVYRLVTEENQNHDISHHLVEQAILVKDPKDKYRQEI